MAKKRVDTGRGRKTGVVKTAGSVKSARKSASNRVFYLLIAVVAVGAITALTYASTRQRGGTVTSPIDTTLPKVNSQGYVMGSPGAPLEVVEFGDFECPQCGRFTTLTEPDVRAHLINTGQIRYRFIDFPLDMHRNTWNASRAAACADQQGKFWEAHDALFDNQDKWNSEATSNPDKVIKPLLEPLVPDKAKFDKCVDDKATQAKIQAHWQIAMARQVQATPTFEFGDKKVEGFVTYDQFKELVDEQLAKSGKGAPSVGGDTAKKGVVLPVKPGA